MKVNTRLSAYIGASLIALVLALTVVLFTCSDAILDSYGKKKMEQAFAVAHPGSTLQIGRLEYFSEANRMVARSVTLSATNTTLRAGQVALIGVHWASLLWGTAAVTDVLANASLDATNLDLELRGASYRITCSHLRGSVPESEIIAEGTELRPIAGQKEFFASHDFRTTLFHVIVPECRAQGLEFGDLLTAKSYRVRSVQFSRPSLDALVNLDKPEKPFTKSPPMVHEALAAIPRPLQIDSLTVSNGSLKYSEQLAAGAGPAVLTIAAVNLSVEGIANHGEKSAAIVLQAQASLMDAGMFKILMSIPINPSDFSLSYSGSLGAMDLTNLNTFLDGDARTRIKSGTVKEAAFEINVSGGKAHGRVRANYRNLEIAVLDKRTGAENGIDNRVASLLANLLKIRSSNSSDAAGLSKEGDVNYTRKPDEEFQQFAWFALRTGVLDLISH